MPRILSNDIYPYATTDGEIVHSTPLTLAHVFEVAESFSLYDLVN